MPPIDFSEMLADHDDSNQCQSIAPWKGFWENVEFDVRCAAPRGHLGYHGGNGWSWENESGKDDYPVIEHLVSEEVLLPPQ